MFDFLVDFIVDDIIHDAGYLVWKDKIRQLNGEYDQQFLYSHLKYNTLIWIERSALRCRTCEAPLYNWRYNDNYGYYFNDIYHVNIDCEHNCLDHFKRVSELVSNY